MSTRSVVSYDDITLPYSQTEKQNEPSSSSRAGQSPPAKKRKKNNQRAKHRDDFRPNQTNTPRSASISQSSEFKKYMNAAFGSNKTHKQQQQQPQEEEFYDEEMEVGGIEGEYDQEASRELTHQEIWDDTALLDAWDAATEEYEVYHGPEKDWKKEPVKKSPLWYNIPVDPSKRSTNAGSKFNATVVDNPSGPHSTLNENAEPDSTPVNFDTFVPTHDPSLDASSTGPADAEATTTMFANVNYIPDTPAGTMVSQDEAFQRALSAMYWSGYWTAMYQCQRQPSQTPNPARGQTSANDEYGAEEPPAEEDDEGIEDDEDDDFISTQR